MKTSSRKLITFAILVLALGVIWVVRDRYILNSDKATQSGVLMTPNAGPNTKVVALGDIACSPTTKQDENNCQMAAVAEKVTLAKPDAILLLGDLQYDKGEQQWFDQVFDKHWKDLKSISFPVPGNHEYYSSANGYFSYWNKDGKNQAGETNKGYYSFDLGGWHIIALNSNCEYVSCDEGSQQIEWLKDDLRQNSKQCTLAFWHHPVFTSGKYQGNTESTERGKKFWKILEKNNVDIVLNGHDHIYERFAKQKSNGEATNRGIREFVVGTGGKSKYSFNKTMSNNHEHGEDGHFGYLELDMKNSAYSWKFMSINGEVLDNGSSGCTI